MHVQAATRLEFHDVIKKYRLMSKREYDGLKADIKAHGQLVPIWTYQGRIIDGRHRYRACLELGIEPLMREWAGEGEGEQVAFVDGLNRHRRHLSASELSMKAAGRVSQGRGRPVKNAQRCAITLDQAAVEENVSKRQVEHARKVKERGVPGLVEAVERGEIPVAMAATIAGLEAEEQTELVAGGKPAIKAKLAEIVQEKKQARAGRAGPAPSNLPAVDMTDPVKEDLPGEMPNSREMDGPEAAGESPGPVAEPAGRGSHDPRGAPNPASQLDREPDVEPALRDRQDASARAREGTPVEGVPVVGESAVATIETEDQPMELFLAPLRRLRRDRRDPKTDLGKFRSRWSATRARRDHVARLQAAEHFTELGECGKCKGSDLVIAGTPCRSCQATGLVLDADSGPPDDGDGPSPWDHGGRRSD